MLNLKCGMLILTVFCIGIAMEILLEAPQTPKGVRYFARISFLNVMIKKKNIPQKYISFGVQ
ncbi:hypothetical protein B0A77_08255 [Flavobacterium branchiophilum]|uniref:Uncharacterized protein n=1 Tax=Flavobacterium branchiophilum TaxID=55197 RepID=A0A2H3KBH3_9FLAO|nr:hypothetical protein B0A77_08255 [Flavobacterium branchiophilum]